MKRCPIGCRDMYSVRNDKPWTFDAGHLRRRGQVIGRAWIVIEYAPQRRRSVMADQVRGASAQGIKECPVVLCSGAGRGNVEPVASGVQLTGVGGVPDVAPGQNVVQHRVAHTTEGQRIVPAAASSNGWAGGGGHTSLISCLGYAVQPISSPCGACGVSGARGRSEHNHHVHPAAVCLELWALQWPILPAKPDPLAPRSGRIGQSAQSWAQPRVCGIAVGGVPRRTASERAQGSRANPISTVPAGAASASSSVRRCQRAESRSQRYGADVTV